MSEQVGAFLALAPYGDVVEGVRAFLERGEGIIRILGEPATGKSACCGELERRLPDERVDVLLLHRPPESVAACEALLRTRYTLNGYATLHRALKSWLKRDRTLHSLVLIVDEAQEGSEEVLEMLALLTNVQDDGRPLVRLVLAGTTALDARLAVLARQPPRHFPGHTLELAPLNRERAAAFFRALLMRAGLERDLDGDAIDLLHQQSGGLPGSLLTLAGAVLATRTSLPAGTISARKLRALIEPEDAPPTMQPATVANIAGGVLLAVALGLWGIASLQESDASGAGEAPTSSLAAMAAGGAAPATTVAALGQGTAAAVPREADLVERESGPGTEAPAIARAPTEISPTEANLGEASSAEARRGEAGAVEASLIEADLSEPDPQEAGRTLTAEAQGTEAAPPLADELAGRVQRWLNDWQRQDVAAYLSHYHPDFAPLYHPSVAVWREDRAARLRAPQSITLSFDRFELVQTEEDRATVHFWMHYRSPTYADETWKELRLRQVDGRWLILIERNLETLVRRP